MAVVSVTNDVHRVDAMDTSLNIFSVGGGAGAGVEEDFLYQGVASISRKVSSSSGSGFQTDGGGAGFDITVAGQENWLAKFIATNKDALNSNGVRPILGTGLNAYYEFLVYTNVTYPKKGGFIVWPIDASIAGYRSATVGSPGALTAVDRWGILGAFSSTSKGENVALDAVDHMTGMFIVGGDGGDADADIEDFLAHDEGTIGNSFGIMSRPEAIDNIYSTVLKLYFGKTSAGTTTALVLTDSNKTLIFRNGFVAAGVFGLDFDLGNAATVVDFSSFVFISEGDTSITDTRAILNAIGTAGLLTIRNSSFFNFADFTLRSGITFDNISFASCKEIIQNSATLTDCKFLTPTTANAVPFLTVDDLSLVTGCLFESPSTGYAVDLGTISASESINWNNTDTGYAATNGTTGNETILVNVASGQTLTINIASGASTPTIHNTGPGTVNVVIPEVTITFTGLSIGGEFRLYDDDLDANPITLGTNREGIESLASTTYVLNHPSSESGDVIYAQFIDPLNFEEQVKEVTLSGVNQTIAFDLQEELNI